QLGAHAADQHFAGCDTDTYIERIRECTNTQQFRELGLQLRNELQHVQRRQAGEPCLLTGVGEWGPPIRHDGVTDIFVDNSLMMADWRGHRRKETVHDLDQPLRRHAFAGTGKSFDVAEQHRHHTALTFRCQRRPLDQTFDDTRIDVFAEGLPQALLEPQLLDHLVERSSQVADFVLRGYAQRLLEMAGLDRPSTFQKPSHRTRHSSTDETREHQTQDGGKERQYYRDQHRLILLAYGQVGILAQQNQHIRAHAVQLLIELVAQFVDALKFIGNRFRVAGIKQLHQPLALGVEVGAKTVFHAL